MRRTAIAAICLALTISSVNAQQADSSTRALSDQQWMADIRQLADAIKEIHFKPFHIVSEETFDTAVEDLLQALPTLTDKEIVVGLTEIVAHIRDGHTRLHIPRLYPELALLAELGHSGTPPPKIESLRFHQSPVRFDLFSDGLYVVGATPEHRRLIGQRVVGFDRTSVEKAIERVRSVSFFENDSRAMLMAPDRLALPEVTRILGISESDEAVTLTTLATDGTGSATALETLTADGSPFVSGTPEPAPTWLANRDAYRWYRVMPDDDAIYVQINEFEENPVAPYGDFVAETLAAAREAGVSRYVVDLRHNSGGIGAWVTPFVTGLAGSEYDEYGRLFVLVGRTTFSAAQFFMHKFEEFTYAMFVGEPSGAKPSHFGDARRVVLENSGLSARISTIYWHSWLANDFRDAIQPHISAPMSSADYFAGRDPALTAALSYAAPATLAAQIEEQFRLEKNQNALLLFGRYMSDASIGNHREAIPGLLAMADRLVDDGLVRQAYFVYFLANASYPGDPDVEAGLERIQALLE